MHYLSLKRAAEAKRQPWNLPESESDWMIKQFFSFKVYGHACDPETTAMMRWCSSTHYRTPPIGGKIRAMVISGMSDDEIARHFATTPQNIAIYIGLFFDIRECLSLHFWMDSFLRPGVGMAAVNTQESAELVWMMVAHHMTREALFHVMSGRIGHLPEEERREFWEMARGMLTGQAFLHMVDTVVINPNGRAVDLERSLQLLDSEARASASGGSGRGTGSKMSTGGGTDVTDWLLEAGDERRIFDPAIWFEVKGGPPRTAPVIDLIEKTDGSFGQETSLTPALGVMERKRRMTALFG
jgi:hypothetical protein